MTGEALIKKFDSLCPFSAAVAWDNPGFLVGDPKRTVTKAALALDATDCVIEEAIEKGADLLVTHHPLLFHPQKTVCASDAIGRRVLKLVENRISLIALHTNFDVCVMADLAAEKLGLHSREILEVTGEREGKPEGFGRLGLLPQEMTLEALAEMVKQRFDLEYVTLTGARDTKVQKAAISTGSGKSGIGACLENQVQVLITGDVDHHTAVDALEMGLCLIDAGHFGTEKMFADYMAGYFEREVSEVQAYVSRMEPPISAM
jgi:dinuclear metal center YbgI/SA1388 family protein